VILGLSITSSWGNGHATTYRSLVRAMRARGHDVLFLERDVPWYAAHRDAPGTGELYASVDELRDRFADAVRGADLAVLAVKADAALPTAEEIADALGCLPPRLRQTLEARVVDGLEYGEIASNAGISEANARMRVARGLRALRSRLSLKELEL
jgi:DNA-directed RNA polymerase specialized sigma24 family protein